MTPPEANGLAGVRVVVPVTERRREFADRLSDAGAVVDAVEFIAIAPTSTPAELAIATAKWCSGQYQWMTVTSRNAVTAMADLARTAGTTLAEAHPAATVAAVGPATLAACVEAGLTVALVPPGGSAAELVQLMPEGSGRVLAPLGNLAAPTLKQGLAAKGWDVDVVQAYRTVDGAGMDPVTADALRAGAVDAVVLTSGSVAERFAAQCPDAAPATRVIAIGATTAATATAAGLRVDMIAATPTYDGIFAALITALDNSFPADPQTTNPQP